MKYIPLLVIAFALGASPAHAKKSGCYASTTKEMVAKAEQDAQSAPAKDKAKKERYAKLIKNDLEWVANRLQASINFPMRNHNLMPQPPSRCGGLSRSGRKERRALGEMRKQKAPLVCYCSNDKVQGPPDLRPLKDREVAAEAPKKGEPFADKGFGKELGEGRIPFAPTEGSGWDKQQEYKTPTGAPYKPKPTNFSIPNL